MRSRAPGHLPHPGHLGGLPAPPWVALRASERGGQGEHPDRGAMKGQSWDFETPSFIELLRQRVHHTGGGGRRGRGGTAAAGGTLAPLPAPRHGPGALVGGVVGTALVPLHVPDAPDRLDLGVLSAEV